MNTSLKQNQKKTALKHSIKEINNKTTVKRETWKRIQQRFIQDMNHVNNSEYLNILNEIFNNLEYPKSNAIIKVRYTNIKKKKQNRSTIEQQKIINNWNQLFLKINKQ